MFLFFMCFVFVFFNFFIYRNFSKNRLKSLEKSQFFGSRANKEGGTVKKHKYYSLLTWGIHS